jgi:L-2,4-diaminobutyrate transaminase
MFEHPAGFTTSGHPAAAAAALANLDIIESEGLVARAGALGEQLLTRLTQALRDRPLVGDVRGCGLMVGVELLADRSSAKIFRLKQKSRPAWREQRSKRAFWFGLCLPTT